MKSLKKFITEGKKFRKNGELKPDSIKGIFNWAYMANGTVPCIVIGKVFKGSDLKSDKTSKKLIETIGGRITEDLDSLKIELQDYGLSEAEINDLYFCYASIEGYDDFNAVQYGDSSFGDMGQSLFIY